MAGRETGRGRKPSACFASSDELRRYDGDGISRLRSRLHAGILYIYRYGPLAQSREQRLCTPEVAGWIPAWSTIHDTGRLLNSSRPVFRTAHRLVAPPRLPCRPSCRRAGRADCLPRNRSTAYDTVQSSHLQQDDTSSRANRRIPLINRYCYTTSDTVVSHHDESCFPPYAPHMRHGERGERNHHLLAASISSSGSAAARSTYLTRKIRFAHFPCRMDFPVALSRRRVIL